MDRYSFQGLGFGLSTSSGLAQISDIGMLIESEGIQGTRVTLTFPKEITEKVAE